MVQPLFKFIYIYNIVNTVNTVSLPNAGVVGWSSFEFGDEKGAIFHMMLKFIPKHFKKMNLFYMP